MAVTFTVNGKYSGATVAEAMLSACKAGNSASSAVAIQYSVGNGVQQVSCFDSNWGWVGAVSAPVITVSGNTDTGSTSTGSTSTAVSDADQIAAINALYPEAVLILAIAWGARYIRRLIDSWIDEQGRADT